jgi:hypothetical protein
LVLYLHKYGYFYLTKGRALATMVDSYINNSRYSTLPSPAMPPNIELIKEVLHLDLPIKLLPTMSHLVLAQSFSRLVTSREV